jgi:hypothetical protein
MVGPKGESISVLPKPVAVVQTGRESASGQPEKLVVHTEQSGVGDVAQPAAKIADAIIKHLGD